ncbi:hypothetical protein F5Y19DRAFT_179305 [Xylariaceae sp. FL1651]|nr:hypothetical protein F5Y19DRAFT_179305 [Xylariaceae sp. FL1651]
MAGQDEARAPEAAPTPRPGRRIPRGTPLQPAKPVPKVVEVNGLGDLTSDWTNDEKDLWLEMYFNPGTSNLSMSYNIQGLQPVIRKINGTQFLLRDANNNFYQWDSDEPGLYLIVDATDLSSALDLIIYHPIMMETQRIGHNLLGNKSGPSDSRDGG